jgi:hypothetical protein
MFPYSSSASRGPLWGKKAESAPKRVLLETLSGFTATAFSERRYADAVELAV